MQILETNYGPTGKLTAVVDGNEMKIQIDGEEIAFGYVDSAGDLMFDGHRCWIDDRYVAESGELTARGIGIAHVAERLFHAGQLVGGFFYSAS